MSSEFRSASSRAYTQTSPMRWILAHLARYWWAILVVFVFSFGVNILTAQMSVFIGEGFDTLLAGGDARSEIGRIALLLVGIALVRGLIDLVARIAGELASKGFERDAREELYLALLGKSQTFHNRQRVGDLMARAANDIKQIRLMVTPGADLLLDASTALVTPFIFIAILDVRLLLAPGIFVVAFGIALRAYLARLGPIATRQRETFGDLNAALAESIQGIEVVKSTASEAIEKKRFEALAREVRDAAIAQGRVQARYLPELLLAITTAGALLHSVWLVGRDEITVGQLVAYLGLLGLLGFPTHISSFAFALVQNGYVSAKRVLEVMGQESTLDENPVGHRAAMTGEIVFDHVAFSYGGEKILDDISFVAHPGETIAIVGETGSGKSSLTKLVNRIYDVDSGCVLIDGIDVREWSLDSLRSQISVIEQEIVLFSRPVAENIAFSLGQQADRAAIERAAHDARAHDFIMQLPEGYDTVIGERGVTLSGGQRQRLAIARALLTDPAILVLDDATSAIDSATEDEIQRAIYRVLDGRTTLLITHRLSQIRWADRVLVLRKGKLVDQGTHDELLARSATYRRIFAHSLGPAPTSPTPATGIAAD